MENGGTGLYIPERIFRSHIAVQLVKNIGLSCCKNPPPYTAWESAAGAWAKQML